MFQRVCTVRSCASLSCPVYATGVTQRLTLVKKVLQAAEESREEGYFRIMDHRTSSRLQRHRQRHLVDRKGSKLERTEVFRWQKAARMHTVEERVHCREATARQRAKEQNGTSDNRKSWTCGKAGPVADSCPKGGNKNLYAIGEEESEVNEKAIDNEEGLQTWCLLEEGETEESRACRTVECGTQSNFESQENN